MMKTSVRESVWAVELKNNTGLYNVSLFMLPQQTSSIL